MRNMKDMRGGWGILIGRHEIMKYRREGRGSFGWD
jgi:hypothetical protein